MGAPTTKRGHTPLLPRILQHALAILNRAARAVAQRALGRTFSDYRMGIDAFSNNQKGTPERTNKIPLSALDRAHSEIEQITDGLNKSIDEGIRDAVAVLRALNLDTTQSCEGHLDRGSPSPYIDLHAPGEPTYRFRGEKEQLEALAIKHDVLPEEIRAWPHEEDRAVRAEKAYNEWKAWTAHPTPEETPEYQAWDAADRKVQATIDKLISEFYAARPKPIEGHVLLEHNRLRTASSLYDRYYAAALDGNANSLTAADREHLRRELPAAQAEFQAFTDFLKQKFFQQSREA